jgi:hypothetical protein
MCITHKQSIGTLDTDVITFIIIFWLITFQISGEQREDILKA